MSVASHRLRVGGHEPSEAHQSRADRWRAYERGKREIGDTARDSQEYEQRLRALAERLGV